MLNFIPWPSSIIFLLCMHVLEKRGKKIRFQPGKEMPEKKGKYLSLEILPAPVQGSIPSPIAVQDVPAGHSVPAGARTHHLPSCLLHWLCCLLGAAREHKPGAVSAELGLCCSSLLRAQRWHSSGGHGREQRGWDGFCSLHVSPRSHLAAVTWW